jgi:hypothetical protein
MADLEFRQAKIEDAITKLTEISADLNKMVAVHELRITQQEKMTDSIEIILEKRRDEVEAKEEAIYETIEKEKNEFTRKMDESFESVSKKIDALEKMMWVYGGGFALAAFIIANWGDVAKLLLKN